MTTGTFVRVYQIAEVLVLTLAHTCIGDPEDAFTALALKLQLLHFLSYFLIQGLEFVFSLNSAMTASHVVCFFIIGLLLLPAKYFLALTATHRVFWEVCTECAYEIFNFFLLYSMSFIKSHFQHSFLSQQSHTCVYLQGM